MGLVFHPALAAAPDIALFQVLTGERLFVLQQFEDGFTELDSCGPGFVTPELISTFVLPLPSPIRA